MNLRKILFIKVKRNMQIVDCESIMQDKDCEDLHLLVQKNLVLSNINAIFAAEFY